MIINISTGTTYKNNLNHYKISKENKKAYKTDIKKIYNEFHEELKQSIKNGFDELGRLEKKYDPKFEKIEIKYRKKYEKLQAQNNNK